MATPFQTPGAKHASHRDRVRRLFDLDAVSLGAALTPPRRQTESRQRDGGGKRDNPLNVSHSAVSPPTALPVARLLARPRCDGAPVACSDVDRIERAGCLRLSPSRPEHSVRTTPGWCAAMRRAPILLADQGASLAQSAPPPDWRLRANVNLRGAALFWGNVIVNIRTH